MLQYIFIGFFIQVVMALPLTDQPTEESPQFEGAGMPDICHGQKYCTIQSTEYPEKVIKDLLMNYADMWSEVVNATIPTNRKGPFYENQCKNKYVTDEIYQLVDEEDRIRYVVQNKERFNQIVYMEECLERGRMVKPTNLLYEKDLLKHEFECKQKFLDFKFVVLSLDGTELEAVSMKGGVPVCCSCELVKLANN